jgi:uncharacterized protein (DUF433 family)
MQIPEVPEITFDPQIMNGQVCVRGMQIMVSLILNLVVNGVPHEDTLKAYPCLEPEDIPQTLWYAA